MAVPTLLELAEAGAHYGHHRSFVYPKAREFVYGVRQNVALIDLVKTQEQLEIAQKVFKEAQDNGKTVLFVGTKRGVREVVKEVATAVGASFVAERWLGGFLSNFETINANIKKMNDLDEYLASDDSKGITKIERIRQSAKLKRYHRFLEGVAELKACPDLIVMASAGQDKIALKEARGQGIPVIAICDTDTNPETIDYPIPANDDATKAVELILKALVSMPTTTKKVAVKVEETEVLAEDAAEEPVAEVKAKKPAVAKKVAKAKPAAKVAAKKAVAKKAAPKVKKK